MNRYHKSDKKKFERRRDVQCHECEGFGHYRIKCPMAKRKEMKYPECIGIGHLRAECLSV